MTNKRPFLQQTYINLRNALRQHANPNWFFTDTQEELIGGAIYGICIFIGLSLATLL